MNFTFHPEAEVELDAAIEYYEGRESGLGYGLAVAVYAAIGQVISLPEAWPVIDGDVRRFLIRRFPYGILYTEEDDEIYIVAVMHLHRHPDYWKHRLAW